MKYLLSLFLFCFGVPKGHSAVVITAVEANSDVIFSYSGTIDLTGLGLGGTLTPSQTRGIIDPSSAAFAAQVAGATGARYTGVFSSLPSNFGSGGITTTGAVIGDPFTISGNGVLVLPPGYSSGSAIAGTATFANESFSSLGINANQSSYTWVIASNGDTFTLNVVPEPSTMAMFIGGAVFALFRRRK